MIKCNRLMLAGFCFLFAAATRLPAQGNTAEVFGGYSYTKANPEAPLPKENMSGWMGGATGYVTKWFGASVEISDIASWRKSHAMEAVSRVRSAESLALQRFCFCCLQNRLS